MNTIHSSGPEDDVAARLDEGPPTNRTLMRRSRARALRVLALTGILLLLAPTASEAAYLEPQAVALGRLRTASLTPVDVSFHNGIPRSVSLDVPAPGATPTEQARAFLAKYADLYGQSSLELDLHPLSADGDRNDVVRFRQTFRGIPSSPRRSPWSCGRTARARRT
jgi:hypothetical protein